MSVSRSPLNPRWQSSLLAVLLLSMVSLASGTSASAAEFFVVPPSSTVLVGEVVTVDFALQADTSEGPGQLDIQLSWGFGGGSQAWTGLGALAIFEAPSIIAPPAIAGSFSPGCAAGSGSTGPPTGDCAIFVAWDALAPGITTVASMSFAYSWRTAPGWEICGDLLDPNCIPASQATFIQIESVSVSGAAGTPQTFDIGTLGDPYIRPVPEPGSALLIGLGLGALASTRRLSPRKRSARPFPSLQR